MLNIEKYKDVILNLDSTNLTCCVNNIICEGVCFDECEECKKNAIKWLFQEYKEPILDDVEKAYLSAVVKPFRNRIKYIYLDVYVTSYYRVNIVLEPVICNNTGYTSFASLPPFPKGTMYKGMKIWEKYTLKDLGL